MPKRKVTLRYLGKNIRKSIEVDHIPVKFYAISIEGRSTKRYHNTIGVLTMLSKCARMLLDFILERMDDKNFVSNNNLLKRDFNELLISCSQKSYSTTTINKAFTELCNRNIIDNDKRRKGIYQVNPMFFFNGSEKAREKLIRWNLESPNRALINKYRREHFLEEED